MPRLSRADEVAVEEFEFEFSAPPVKENTRRSKHDPRWEAARNLCKKNKGQSLKVLTYNQPSSAYSAAKDINNGDHRMFKDDSAEWLAVAGKVDADTYAVWLTYRGPQEEEA